MSFEEKLREKAEQLSAGQAMIFAQEEVYVLRIETITDRTFTRADRTWDSKLYKGFRYRYDAKGVIIQEEPIQFWGNTVLDNELHEGTTYILIYKGKTKGYHDYQLTPIDAESLAELAKS